ncbi:MAG: hypothetical protein H0T79_16080 [Deltaproteobacteria bacterium]|nr:hypothetical protein [Deltaproteobacteria bacterium]
MIELTGGGRFEDVAKEIIKWNGEDHVVFAQHELLPVRQIADCWRAWPTEHTYDHRIS